MTAQIIPFPRRPAHPEMSHGCPHCGRHDGTLNLKAVHWAICETHKVKWRLGMKLAIETLSRSTGRQPILQELS